MCRMLEHLRNFHYTNLLLDNFFNIFTNLSPISILSSGYCSLTSLLASYERNSVQPIRYNQIKDSTVVLNLSNNYSTVLSRNIPSTVTTPNPSLRGRNILCVDLIVSTLFRCQTSRLNRSGLVQASVSVRSVRSLSQVYTYIQLI